MTISKKTMWLTWVLVTASLSSYYAYGLVAKNQAMYLPGNSTAGHYQIELACNVCHTDAFGGMEAMQEACVKCHGKELKAVDDSHPKSKFTDPRNADRVAILDARYCVTCHEEHRLDRTRAMGVTLPDDYCAYCHFDIEEDRPSHADMAFDSCADAGCHNYHDNKALYEDFLVKHNGEPNLVNNPRVPSRNFRDSYVKRKTGRQQSTEPLLMEQAVYPKSIQVDQQLLTQWESTAHAKVSVNCMDCHSAPSGSATKPDANASLKRDSEWLDSPPYQACRECHDLETKTYLSGKHGMRLLQDLPPMQPALARQPMKSDVNDHVMGCSSCHGAHGFNSQKAAVDACLNCHDDDHSLAYRESPHFKVWQDALNEAGMKGQGVSCATCHMPREEVRHQGVTRIRVQHNQNHNLRPNEKMIRDVCMHCHGLAFAIDALADPALIANNFNGAPATHIASMEMAIKREKEKAEEKLREAGKQ